MTTGKSKILTTLIIWFIAVMVGSVLGTCNAVFPLHDGLATRVSRLLEPYFGEILSMPLAYFVPPIFLSLVIFRLLDKFRKAAPDPVNETRCRKCNYILRGITEPRCPECGEKI